MTTDTNRTPTTPETTGPKSTTPPYTDLVHQVDRRSSGPDRVTVFPADATDDERMSAWVTVDLDSVIEPECFR
ncbi:MULTISPECIES: hypothetical protein [Halorubrum]|jgi:hypothetical protein|uniref:DUF7511 domain-containing protein n=1 Tax=Halorubrum tropicale TaxID=1765655 RepID=A0A0N0UAX9_9EURY|nr:MULTISPECIES: hypothetical protein [Halorubrum]KOX97684.1 hypothetical protein AMR74_01940 [Halorubrum tropicale]RLM50868.1 hypothetical protein DVK06_08180 [Halorubrum sp. Atlit-28R]TKX43484.1 hypothetical protein EXE50_09920 [Halorubrum sp. ARQ200]TKX50695.1 hypothetical protein EXE49_06385 [Halorubrum sp. ASP121]